MCPSRSPLSSGKTWLTHLAFPDRVPRYKARSGDEKQRKMLDHRLIINENQYFTKIDIKVYYECDDVSLYDRRFTKEDQGFTE